MKYFVMVLSISILITSVTLGYAQPNIPKETIPSGISSEVKEQIEKLYSQSSVERSDAIEKLGTFGATATPAIPFLISLLAEPGDGQLLIGIRANGEKFEWALILFSLSTGKQDISIGQKSAIALTKIGESVVEPLITALKNEDFVARFNAVEALGNTKDNRALEPLIAVLKDEYPPVRFNAVIALGKIKGRRAITPLEDLLKDSDYAVQRATAESLKMITGKDYKTKLPKQQVEPACITYPIDKYKLCYKEFKYI
ncbi:MAG: HEAT repeat domain-containing protein [Candidatus Omnitrophota bacterium]|jgi:HEAT repeat protein